MKLHHVAIWTFQLEELRDFYIRYFDGSGSEKYVNPRKGFESYFVHFEDGAGLELMRCLDLQKVPVADKRTGLTHLAFLFDSQDGVLRQTELLRSEGYTVGSEPRITGDGYFESVVLDPDGNRIECVFKL